MGRYINYGDVIRTLHCKHCDRIFTGDKKTVDKQFQMHNKYTHGSANENVHIIKMSEDKDNNRIYREEDFKKEILLRDSLVYK